MEVTSINSTMRLRLSLQGALLSKSTGAHPPTGRPADPPKTTSAHRTNRL